MSPNFETPAIPYQDVNEVLSAHDQIELDSLDMEYLSGNIPKQEMIDWYRSLGLHHSNAIKYVKSLDELNELICEGEELEAEGMATA